MVQGSLISLEVQRLDPGGNEDSRNCSRRGTRSKRCEHRSCGRPRERADFLEDWHCQATSPTPRSSFRILDLDGNVIEGGNAGLPTGFFHGSSKHTSISTCSFFNCRDI